MVSRMVRKYWRDMAQKSFVEARELLGLNSRLRVLMSATVVLAIVLALLFWGSEDAANDEILARVAAAAVVIIFFPVIWGWRFICAPAETNNEKNTQIEALEHRNKELGKRLAERAIAKANVMVLSVFRESGLTLAEKRITDSEWENWLEEVEMWKKVDVRFIATKFSHQEASSFRSIKYHTIERFVYRLNDRHNDDIQKMMAHLAIMDQMLERNRNLWAPITTGERREAYQVLDAVKAHVLAAKAGETG